MALRARVAELETQVPTANIVSDLSVQVCVVSVSSSLLSLWRPLSHTFSCDSPLAFGSKRVYLS